MSKSSNACIEAMNSNMETQAIRILLAFAPPVFANGKLK